VGTQIWLEACHRPGLWGEIVGIIAVNIYINMDFNNSSFGCDVRHDLADSQYSSPHAHSIAHARRPREIKMDACLRKRWVFSVLYDRIPCLNTARLLACLDIYQALGEDRPYRKAMSHEEAMSIMRQMVRDGQIDGGITEDIEKCVHM